VFRLWDRKYSSPQKEKLYLPEESASSDRKSEERERDIHIMLQNASLFAATALSDQ